MEIVDSSYSKLGYIPVKVLFQGTITEEVYKFMYNTKQLTIYKTSKEYSKYHYAFKAYYGSVFNYRYKIK